MPRYVFLCANDHQVEVTQHVDDALPAACGKCGAPVQQVYTPPNVIWRGGAPTPRFHGGK